MRDIVRHCTFFAVHPSRPYAIAFSEGFVQDLTPDQSGRWGFYSYLGDLQTLYPPHFLGPFTIGVTWQGTHIESAACAD